MDDLILQILSKLDEMTRQMQAISIIQQKMLDRLEHGDERFKMIEGMLATQMKYCDESGCRNPSMANILDHLKRNAGDIETMVIEWREKKDAAKEMKKDIKKELTSKAIGIILTVCGMGLSAVGAFILAKLMH